MRILNWLVIPAGAMLVGCASVPNPAAIGPNHPANPKAAAAPTIEPTSPLVADLAAAKHQPKPQSMPQMHMQGGMHHGGAKQKPHQAGEDQ